MAESRFQKKTVDWLKGKGCYVIVTSAVAGVPAGCPDVIALMPSGRWAALEIKTGLNAKFQPLQKATIAKLDAYGYAKAVWPENFEETKRELLAIM